MDKKRYVLEMNTEQAKLLSRACEFYARMMMGQWQELVWHCLDLKAHPDDYCEARENLENLLMQAKHIAWPELEPHLGHSWGVGKFRDADMVWELYEVVRHCIAWTEHPDGGITVDFGRPMSFSGEPLAKCKSQLE